MKSTVQRFRFIGITVLSILVFTIMGVTFPSSAYAAPVVTMTLNISPNPALPGQAVTFSGTVASPAVPADSIRVSVFSGGPLCPTGGDIGFIPLAVNLAPSTIAFGVFTGTALSDGSYSITAPSGFPVGSYGVSASDLTASFTSLCDPLTVSTVIPEYPFGLPLLAIFMIIGYGLVRRRTRNNLR